jgi:hypothetical protein
LLLAYATVRFCVAVVGYQHYNQYQSSTFGVPLPGAVVFARFLPVDVFVRFGAGCSSAFASIGALFSGV